jgi:hypothetical protein
MKKSTIILGIIGIILLVPILCDAQIKQDKIYHAGAGVSITGGVFYSQYLCEREMNPIAPSLIGITAGFGKEMYDVMDGRFFSYSDFAYTAISSVITNIILEVIHKPRKKMKKYDFDEYNPPLVKK